VSGRYVIISTLWRDDDGEDPQKILRLQLAEDSWPTREYNPNEIVPILESEGFTCKIVRENPENSKEISDGYFIIGRREG